VQKSTKCLGNCGACKIIEIVVQKLEDVGILNV